MSARRSSASSREPGRSSRSSSAAKPRTSSSTTPRSTRRSRASSTASISTRGTSAAPVRASWCRSRSTSLSSRSSSAVSRPFAWAIRWTRTPTSGRSPSTALIRRRRSAATRNPASAERAGATDWSRICDSTTGLHMVERLPVRKTYKLFIGGAFPRSESGRTYEAEGQNVARASRKDARDAVRAARGALPKWAGMTAYNRGQVLYRLAEMVEARSAEFAEVSTGRHEVERTVDRIVWYAGWADKLAQVLGSANPVSGPYFNFTVPEPTGVVAVVAPDEPPLLGLETGFA